MHCTQQGAMPGARAGSILCRRGCLSIAAAATILPAAVVTAGSIGVGSGLRGRIFTVALVRAVEVSRFAFSLRFQLIFFFALFSQFALALFEAVVWCCQCAYPLYQQSLYHLVSSPMLVRTQAQTRVTSRKGVQDLSSELRPGMHANWRGPVVAPPQSAPSPMESSPQ